MTPPIRPEASSPRQARIRRNLERLKAANAPQDDIDAYLASERVTPEQEMAAMPRTTLENVRGGLGSALQGATFNFSDELVGLGRGLLDPNLSVGEAIGEERQQLREFREANPKTALGLELGGGLVSGLGAAKVATAGIPAAARAGRVLASGVGGGAIAGAGAGEGVQGRAVGAGIGAGVGGLLGALGAKIAQKGGDVAESATRRLTDAATDAGGTPSIVPASSPDWGRAAQRATIRAVAPEGDFGKARTLLGELEKAGMGEQAMLMNVGDDVTVRAARAAANQPGSRAGQLVNERLARQGGALGEAVPRDIEAVTTGAVQLGPGRTPPAIRVEQMLREAQEKAAPFYEEARNLGDIFPERAAREAGEMIPQTPFDAFLDSPLGQRTLAKAKQYPQFANLPDTDMRVLDQVYKEMGGLADEAVRAGNREQAQMLRQASASFRDVLAERAPVYGKATAAYRGEAAPRQAFAEGMEQFRSAAPGEIELAQRGADEVSQEARRLGVSAAMQAAAEGKTSNVDLGDLAQFRDVARSVVGTPEVRNRIIETFGQAKYEELLGRLMPKIRAAAQNAAARGNSTTTKQLLDALAFGDDAMLDAIQGLATGRPAGAIAGWVGRRIVGPAEQAYRLGIGRTAEQTADMLTTSGSPQIRSLLEMLEQRAGQDAAQRQAGRVVGGAAGRALAPEMR